MADAQVIDKLAVEITSNITGEAKLQRFTKALSDLASVSHRVNTNNLQSTAYNVKTFANALNGINTNGVKNFSNALSRLATIKPNTSGLNALSSAIHNISSVSGDVKGITNLTNSLARLSKADMSGFNSGAFSQITNGITTLAQSLSAVDNIDSNITRMVTAIAKLGSSGQYISNVSAELPRLGMSLTTLVKDLQGVGVIDAEIAKLVDGIARLANAGKKAADTTANLDQFGNAVVSLVRKLQSVGDVNTNLANTIQGLGNLAANGVRSYGNVAQVSSVQTSNLGGSLKRLGGIVGRIINPFTSFTEKLGLAKQKSKSLASTIGKLYAGYFMLFRGIRALGGAGGKAQDYIEDYNYFNVALQKIGKDNKNLYKRYGYEDAETYADSFQDRFTALQKQMTGYDVDSRTGDLHFEAVKSGGLDISDTMRYQAQISQITNSTGQLGEVSITAAKAMSMLAADFSSLSNTDLTNVQENFMSALNGQTRAVYKYGVNLTQASLQQIAYNHGITDSVAKMSMASKQQLRLIGMLEQSKVAWGDLNRTLDQPANQLRRLQAGFSNLARTIGSLFIPLLQAVYPILNGIVMVLQEFFQWIAKIAGIKMPDMGSITMPDVEAPADDMGDLADNTDKAAKKAKKLSDNLQGFDEINKLEKNTDTSGDTKSPKSPKDIDLSGDLNDLFKQYEKAWNDAFKNAQDKAAEYAKKIKEALLKGWNNGGDFTFLGKKVGKWITDNLAKIPWDKIQAGVNKVTKSLATFLNGVIYGTDWKVVGNTVAQAFNTIVGALYTWYDTFDFLQFGKSLGEGLATAINNFDWKKLGGMLGLKLRGIIQFAFGFITTLDFKKLGKSLTNAINEFLSKMGKIDPRTGLSGWAELGKTIGDAIKGLLDTIIEVLDGANWTEIGKAIADFLGSIDWLGILKRVGEIIVKALWSAIKVAFSAFANDPLGTGLGIASILGGLFAFGKLKGLISIISTNLGKVFNIGVKQAVQNAAIGDTVASAFGSGTGGGIFSKLFSKLGSGMSKLATKINTSKLGMKFGGDTLAPAWSTGANAMKTIFGNHFNATLAAQGTKGAGAYLKAFGAGIKNAAVAPAIGTALGTAILGGFAVFAGSKIGEIINGAIDENVQSHQNAIDTGKQTGHGIMKQFTDRHNNIMDGAKADYKPTAMSANELEKAYTKLANKTHRSAAETQTMKDYAKQLKEIYPEVGKSIDKSTTAFKESIKVAKRHQNILKAEQNVAEVYAKKNDLKSKLPGDDKNLAQAKKVYDATVEETKRAKAALDKDDSDVNKARWERAVAEMGAAAQEYNNLKSANDELHKSYDKSSAKLEKYNNLLELGKIKDNEYKETTSKVQKKIEDLGESHSQAKRHVSNLRKMVDDGTLSWNEYKKIANGAYKSQDDLNSAIFNAISKSAEYRNVTKALANDLLAQGKTTDQAQSYQKKLDNALKDGRISMSEYKKIVNESKGSVDKLSKAISNIPAKKSTTIKVGMSGLEAARRALNNLTATRQVNINVRYNGTDGDKLTESQTKKINAETAVRTVLGGTVAFRNAQNIDFKVLNDGTIKMKKNLRTLYADELRKRGFTVKAFKQGGFLEDGLFTMNKNEMAGKFDNNRSVVANNEMITNSIAQAVGVAMHSAIVQGMREVQGDGNGEQNINVYLDGKQLADNNVKYIKQMNRSNNRPVFA